MSCDSVRELLPDYLAGSANAEARERVESHLAGCLECAEDVALWERLGALPEERPGPELRVRFRRMLDAEAEKRGNAWWKAAWFRPAWQGALALALAAGGFAGGRASAPGPQGSGDAASLREEVRSLREMVTLSLLQQTSAVERLRGVSFSSRLENPDQDVRAALIRTLKSDPSVDVRLAAVDALRRYRQDTEVRQGLIDALARQSPLVQIALIDSLVEIRDRGSVDAFERLAADRDANDLVRQRAGWGLQQLKLRETRLE